MILSTNPHLPVRTTSRCNNRHIAVVQGQQTLYAGLEAITYTRKVKKFPILKGTFRDHIHLEKAMKQGETYTLPMHPIPKLLHACGGLCHLYPVEPWMRQRRVSGCMIMNI